MRKGLLEQQINDARINFNYFFMTMIIKIFKVTIVLGCVLLINQIFDILLINIFSLIYTLITIYIMYKITNNYNYILQDIKRTLGEENLSFTIDKRMVKSELFGEIVRYGK